MEQISLEGNVSRAGNNKHLTCGSAGRMLGKLKTSDLSNCLKSHLYTFSLQTSLLSKCRSTSCSTSIDLFLQFWYFLFKHDLTFGMGIESQLCRLVRLLRTFRPSGKSRENQGWDEKGTWNVVCWWNGLV